MKEKLVKLQNTLQKIEKEKAQLEGRRDSLLQDLKSEFNCSSLEEAAEKKEQMLATEKKLKTKLDKKINKLNTYFT